MSNPLEYVITGALMKCSQGTVPMPFKATPRTSKIAGLQAANALDKAPLVNIPSFVICQKLTQMAGGTPTPCTPAPTMWQDTYPAKVGGAEALLCRSCITCPVGQGKIEFMTSGQLPLPPDMSQQIKETKEEADEALEQAEKEKNSVGEAGLLEGMIPIWGSGRDLIHSIQTGDKVGMALNAAFLVWDVASVAAGVLSFGTATAAMMGAKAGVRTALKAGTKVAAGMAKKQMAELAAKAVALKGGLKALKPFGKKVAKECVTACFPAGTLVAIEGDYCNIEDIRVGDMVWAWEQDQQNLALKPVISVSQHEAHALVEVHVGDEVIRATPEHPFLLSTREWKLAGQLEVGDELLRSDQVSMPVREVVHQTEQTTPVYNFEVADWHTYLVSFWMLIVHNGPCDDIAKLVVGKATTVVRKTKKELDEAYAAAKKIINDPKKIDEAYAAYKKKKGVKARTKKKWYPGYEKTANGRLGEYQADIAFANEGHIKLDSPHTALDAPAGRQGLDGVWRNATPPPEYIVTETKFDTAKLSKGQMSDNWIRKNLNKLSDQKLADKIRDAMDTGQVEKRLLQVSKETGEVIQTVLK
ncbi:polymorphic toxin-type HINT domain-containing protein [Hymenobacter fodinae]|uniref:DUF4280 domain-containing protein n=1 Tax=Hymenobacter fodinae TaxID=2510796 RepID=A0A4Z0P657_9BACT|nr:polymorphic toxin-type HINT domain-containing protein [Hymenobacter fodinae]TGE07771.1 DUF4280 domain-containing protein [Hymenobacter fodinae]